MYIPEVSNFIWAFDNFISGFLSGLLFINSTYVLQNIMKSFFRCLSIINFILNLKASFSDSLSVEEPESCHIFQAAVPLYQLKNHIFCDYESSIRPNKQGQNTTVNIIMMPKKIEYVSIHYYSYYN